MAARHVGFGHRAAPVLLMMLSFWLAGCAQTPRQTFSELVTEDFSVAAADPGVQLHVRNKRPTTLTRYAPDNVILFVHGATGSPETGFDLALDGLSWMDWMARQGNDVYFVSVRGYGRSTRPREMDAPPLENPPVVRTPDAVRDVGTAVDFIRARRGVAKVTLIGHSWGATIMPAYTAGHNDKVHRLAMFAPGWLRTQGVSPTDGGGKLGAYRVVTEEGVRRRRGSGLPPGKQEELMPARWLDAYFEAAFASDPWSATQKPRAFRAPNGVVQDSREFTNVGRPLYDPAQIRVPRS